MEEEVSSSIKKIARGAGIVFFGSIISKAIMYFYRMVVARWLGPADYGLISMGLAVFWLAVTISHLGVPGGITRRVSHFLGRDEKDKASRVIKASLSTTIPWSLVVAATVFLLSDTIATIFFKNSAMGKVIRIFSIAIPFQILFRNLESLVRGFREVKYFVYVDKLFRSIFTLLVTVLLIWRGWGIDGALYAQLGGIVLSAVLMLLLVQRKVYPFLGKQVEKLSIERNTLLRYSLPLFLSGIIGTLMGYTDTLILGFYSASESVGVYNAALPTAQTMKIIGSAMGTMLFPTVSKLYSQGNRHLSEEVSSVALKWIFLVNFPLLVFITFFGRSVLRLLFGEAYTSGTLALGILGLAYFIGNFTSHNGSFIKSEDRTDLSLKITLFLFVMNLVLNIILIPELGNPGAAVATAFSTVTGSVIGTFIVWRKFGINPYRLKDYVVPVVSTLISGIIVYTVLKLSFNVIPIWALVPGALVFGIVYGILFLKLGGVNEHDLEILRAVDRKTGDSLKFLKEIVRKLIK